MEKHILLISCTDQKGLIAKIGTIVATLGLNITTLREFVEEETGRFFMRMELTGRLEQDVLHQQLVNSLPTDAWVVINPKEKKDIVVLVTKEYHCLSDLLSRHHFDELPGRIRAVIGNYETLKPYTEQFGIPYHYVSHEGKSKEQFEQELIEVVKQYSPDFLVLAKFMRILSPTFVSQFENRIINIHHSFLPAFIGANPYKQAYERGVKLIGATAHIVNNNLDEGPIITQSVHSVDHRFSIRNMVLAGHEIEKNVLSEALKLVLEDRVFVVGNKTIIFS